MKIWMRPGTLLAKEIKTKISCDKRGILHSRITTSMTDRTWETNADKRKTEITKGIFDKRLGKISNI